MSDSSYTFDSPDADFILRAPLRPDDPESAQFKDFHTHKAILSTASTVFHDMFSLPQPHQSAEDDANLPIVPVVEPAEIFEIFLRLIYPIELPTIDSPRIVGHLLQVSEKYMTNGVHTRLKQVLASPSFLKSDPIWVYAIACRMDLDEEAQLAVRHTYKINLIRDIPPPLLQEMTTETYNRLLGSHATRREELTAVVNKTECPQRKGKCICGIRFYTNLKKEITLAIWERPFLDRRRLDSCLPSSKGPKSACELGLSCRLSARVISSYFNDILDGVESLNQTQDG